MRHELSGRNCKGLWRCGISPLGNPCQRTRGMNCWRPWIDIPGLHAHALRTRRLYDAALHYSYPHQSVGPL